MIFLEWQKYLGKNTFKVVKKFEIEDDGDDTKMREIMYKTNVFVSNEFQSNVKKKWIDNIINFLIKIREK